MWDTHRHSDAHPGWDVVPILVQDAARGPATGNARRLARPPNSPLLRHMTGRPGAAGPN
jgi:hypothetical protein